MPRKSRIDAVGALHHAVRELGITQVDLSKRLNLSPAAVTFVVRRGECLAWEIGMPFVVDTKM